MPAFSHYTGCSPAFTALVKEVTDVCRYLWQKGWAERNAGNLSVRVTDMFAEPVPDGAGSPVFPLPEACPGLAGEVFFLTGTGRRMRDVAEDPARHTLLVRISATGNQFSVLSHDRESLGDLRPTSELPSHLAIHRHLKMACPEKKAVVHTHPGELIALTHLPKFRDEALLNRVILGMHPEAVVFLPQGVGLVPYVITGSRELGSATLAALENHDVVVWEKHGCLAVAPGPAGAFDLIDLVCKSASVYLLCRNAGFEPEGLSADQVRELKKTFCDE